MSIELDDTMYFQHASKEAESPQEILQTVYQALLAKGYNPINQIVGYLISGDPAYITSHLNARNIIRKIERDELMEELVTSYLKKE